MKHSIRVHAFKVIPSNKKQPLEALLNQIDGDSLEDRLKTVNMVPFRVEWIQLKDGLWHIDFVKFRNAHGPGAASRKTRIRGFEFDPGEVFGEETAVLYCPTSRYAVVQYNHNGPRVGTIEDYLTNYSDAEVTAFEFRPKFDPDAERRFSQRAATRKFTFTIDPRDFSNADRDHGMALTHAIDMGLSANAARVQVSISLGREPGGLSKKASDSIAAIMRAAQRTNGVSQLEVGFAAGKDEKMEVVDLLEHRLLHVDSIETGPDLRFPRADRFRVLKRAYSKWQKLF